MQKTFSNISKYLLLACCLAASVSFAQSNKKVGILYKYEATGMIGLHTRGVTLGFRKGYNKSSFKQRFWEVEIMNIKHPKEVRSSSLYSGGKSYSYDKINSFLPILLGVGQQRPIVRRESEKSVGISAIYSAGLSLGVLSRKHILYWRLDGTGYDLVEYSPDEHASHRIYGGGPISSGFSKLRMKPGLYLKSGLQFSYNQSQNIISALECGVIVQSYFETIPIMFYAENKRTFISLYLSLRFGYRWNNN